MAGAPEQLDRVRRLRMSLVILAISLGGFYYSSQITLDYQAFWWVKSMAFVSAILFIVGLVMTYIDWNEERNFRSAQTQMMENQGAEPEPEPEDPAEPRSESDRPPYNEFKDILKND